MPVRNTNPAGSSSALRSDVLRALGVVKIATADQIQRLTAPHLTYRHTTKPTARARKAARTSAYNAALTDLRRHGLVETGGWTRTGDALRTLTPRGLAAAAYELGRPAEEMGGTARAAAAAGGTHPLAVTETILALLRPAPNLDLVANEPEAARHAAQAAAHASPGLGSLSGYATEVPLPATGTWARPGRGGAQADLVLTAPEDDLPLLFVEVDNCHETAERLAAKIDRYARFFRRRVRDTDGQEQELWSTRWSGFSGLRRRSAYPPVLIVFNRVGARNPDLTVQRLSALTRPHWEGEDGYGGGPHAYDGKIPLVATTLELLRAHGPAGEVFHRFGRTAPQRLLDAIALRPS
ncbi:replication-relaxation family protein [Streptomyces alkaliterrae]|uniref:Replication-relaxation family protein n=1 Tax=Streptomyces alkaliterrae TaxID=2213162 RepID=A0A5P0YUD8_9ACTN|nr:replication-relaxation family protein [Streptomyces alkaliterrae]MBB1260168.1 replication-relaxation family protein [Streptomyces alkaliterrae]MQS02089.1 hypothetical protein [Streptomyces alkaliterrae]